MGVYHRVKDVVVCNNKGWLTKDESLDYGNNVGESAPSDEVLKDYKIASGTKRVTFTAADGIEHSGVVHEIPW